MSDASRAASPAGSQYASPVASPYASPAGSRAARGFYGALLDQKTFWEQTMQAEHAVRLELPRTNQTDGVELANKVYHSLVRDMIIRHNILTVANHKSSP